VKSCRK